MNSRLLLKWKLLSLLVLGGMADPLPDDIRADLLDSQVFKELKDSSVPDDPLLIFASGKLPTAVPEEPGYWSRIVNDAKFSAARRRFALTMLVKRHVRPGLSLGELAEMFKGHQWIKREYVGVVGAYTMRCRRFG